MDYTSYSPNNKSPSSSSITPILIPSSHSTKPTHTKITRKGKNKGAKYNNNISNTNKTNNSNTNNINNSSNNNNKGGVRLSTDPQSVAARERRHRISERFKILQSLIPGGAKLDTVSLLDHAIHYVNFLKAQIWLHHQTILYDNNHNNHTLMHHNNDDNSISSTVVNNSDAAYYDYHQHCCALMLYNNNNNNNNNNSSNNHNYVSDHQQVGGAEGNMAVAWNQAAQIQDLWGYQQNDLQRIGYKRHLV